MKMEIAYENKIYKYCFLYNRMKLEIAYENKIYEYCFPG